MLRRAAIAGELRSWVEAFAIGEAEPAEIDTVGLTASAEEHRPDIEGQLSLL
jgi:hypothetical protein